MSIRTDLAAESAQQISPKLNIEGLTQNISVNDDASLEITDISILTDNAAQLIGKPKGRYITLKTCSEPFDCFSPAFEQRGKIIASHIKTLCNGAKRVLVAGLGNPMITPDALGPMCADKIFATRHIKMYAHEIDSSDLAEVSVIQTGVLGQTGIEASEQVKAVCKKISPDIVIAVDALACSELDHLGCTVQLCSTGISPGSGVENARKELSLETLGIPCIALGVPTVIDLSTAVEKISGFSAPKSTKGMTVTPHSIDKLVKNSAEYLALGINLALHPTLTPNELRSLTQ